MLPGWLWLWFPPLLLITVLPLRLIAPDAYATWVIGERALIELATPLLALTGAVFGVAALRVLSSDSRLLRTWIWLVVLGCIYFAGEEISWGQHLLRWETPSYIEAVNDQQETNLHNVSSWFDQKPRLLLEIWVLVGGIFVPLAGLARPAVAPAAFRDWFWPTIDCTFTAALAILVRLPERIKKWADIDTLPLEVRFSEFQEYYFALFLMLYLAAIYTRGRERTCGATVAPPA